MIRYIPEFILRKYDAGLMEGSFTGFALFLDIADFTPIGTQMQKHGRQGAEELRNFLDLVFGEPLRIVESHGGFASIFAGDAFCAIFPLEETSVSAGTIQPILASVLGIKAFFQDKSTYTTPLGQFNLLIRQAVSFGEIRWQIFDSELQNEYAFFGDPLREMEQLSSLKQDLVFSTKAALELGLADFTMIADTLHDKPIEGYCLKNYPAESAISMVNSIPEHSPVDDDAFPLRGARFLNPKYHFEKPQPEIRSAAFCFADLDAISPEDLPSSIDTIQALADRYGGFVNKYDLTDKGLIALLLFGLPVNEGKTLERICGFALEAVEALPQLALGISCGAVYAGFTGSGPVKEYTALGTPLNLAARLMSKARPGEILTDSFLWQEQHAAYDFGYLGSVSLKGIEKPVRYYRLKRQAVGKRDENSFVGRENELAAIRGTVGSALQSKENTILYVSGDAGIGKSRLASEALAIYGSSHSGSTPCHLFSITCDAINRKPLEAIKQMLRGQFYYNAALPSEAAIPMFRALWSTIAPGDPEMQRIESILASLLGFEWEGSVWSILPPEERPKQLKQAFVYFIGKLCQSKALLIHLDDGQWLDDDSMGYFQAVSEAEMAPVIFVSPCRYLEDGSKADLKLPKHLRKDIELESLSDASCQELIKGIMRLSDIPKATLGLIYGRSMGNPMFIEQLCSYLLETGSVNARGEAIKELDYLSSFSISDIVSSRIDRLTDNVKDCLYSASILGMTFNIRVLSRMLNSDLSMELETGTHSRIWKDLDELRYIFSHILIKDIVYQRMMSEKLTELHTLAAQAMEQVYADALDENAEEIATHYEKAGMNSKAAHYYEAAGDWHGSRFEYRNAEANYQQALAFTDGSPGVEGQRKALLYSKIGSLYHNLAQYPEALDCHQRALAIQTELQGKDHPDTAASYRNIGLVYWVRDDFENSIQYLDKALRIRQQAYGDDSLDTAESYRDLGNLHFTKGVHKDALMCFRKALDIRIKLLGEDHPLIAESYTDIANIHGHMGIRQQEIEYNRKALDLRIKLFGDRHPDTAVSYHETAGGYVFAGEYDKAFEYASKALDIMLELYGEGHPSTVDPYNILGFVYQDFGQYHKSLECFEKGIRVDTDLFGKLNLRRAVLVSNMAGVYVDMGQFDRAISLVNESIGVLAELLKETENPWLVNSYGKLGYAYMGKEDYESAREYYRKASSIARKLGYSNTLDKLFIYYGRCLYHLGSYDEARSAVMEGIANATQKENTEWVFIGRMELAKIELMGFGKRSAFSTMTHLLDEADVKDEPKALLYYELWEICQNWHLIPEDQDNPVSIPSEEELKALSGRYRMEALRLYQQLYEKKAAYDYQNRIKRLSGNNGCDPASHGNLE